LTNNDGVLRGDTVIRFVPDQFVLKLDTGDRVRVSADRDAADRRLGAGRLRRTVRSMSNKRSRRRLDVVPVRVTGAIATGPSLRGPMAIAALATGAGAIGALAIGRLAIGRATIKQVRIDQLDVGKLRVEDLEIAREQRPPASSPPT
jgi:hypothetical protein